MSNLSRAKSAIASTLPAAMSTTIRILADGTIRTVPTPECEMIVVNKSKHTMVIEIKVSYV